MNQNLRNNIKKMLKERKLTRKDLAEKSGISISQLNGLFRGVRKFHEKNLEKIAKALDVEIYQLFIPQAPDFKFYMNLDRIREIYMRPITPVYCENCKFYEETLGFQPCHHPDNLYTESTWLREETRYKMMAENKNKKNDCKDFSPKEIEEKLGF
jgi:transcriptional regulator with XRE-family HTH domain